VKKALLLSGHRYRRAWLCEAVLLLCLVITACSSLRFRGLTPETPLPSGDPPLLTPTVAPVLLTPVASATELPTSDPVLPTPTPTFGLPLPDPTCDATPMWGLGDVWNNQDVRTRLGCPVTEQLGLQGEEMHFQHGVMILRPDVDLIYVLFERRQPQGWGAYTDGYLESDLGSDPSLVSPTTKPGTLPLLQPTGPFGKLWRENAWLRETLGWAVGNHPDSTAEAAVAFAGAVQDFEGGVLLWNGSVCFVLRTDDMSWDMY